MKLLIVSILCVYFTSQVLSYTTLGRSLNPYTYRVRTSEESHDDETQVEGVYTYVDKYGLTHYVKYIAGPKIGFKIIDDSVESGPGKIYFQTQNYNGYSVPNVDVQEVVKVHHIRNEVPATVHKTTIPDLVYHLAAPPLLARRV